MKLRFEVNQAECFRRGIDAPTSIVTIEANPSELPQEVRDKIADRMSGIDVMQCSGERRVVAIGVTLQALVDAI